MTKALAAVAILCTNLWSATGTDLQEQRQKPPETSAQSVNQVIQWNKILLAIVRTPGVQPAMVHPTRSFAMMHAAVYDAVNGIDRTHAPYLVKVSGVPRHTSQEAAAAGAAHEVLAALYPTLKAALDTDLQQSLADIGSGREVSDGLRVGEDVGDRIVALRSNDGSDAPPVLYVFGTAPGDYQSTPPNFPKQPQFTSWSHVTPFALQRADQFRPEAPPTLDSDAYADDFNKTKSLGIANSTAATADQALTGRFWNGAIQNYWNEITQTAAIDFGLTTAQSARLFALLNLSFADSVIAFYDAKYTYNFWRPVTAIQNASTAINPNTVADPNWLPEVGNTTPDPSYPGAHAVISAAGATVLISFFDGDHLSFQVTSEVLPKVERSFDSFSAAAQEATLSRIFAGVHFKFDLTSGQSLGRHVADFVLDNFLTPRGRSPEEDEDQ
jgi:membrane-associated phospholipid phosphatase